MIRYEIYRYPSGEYGLLCFGETDPDDLPMPAMYEPIEVGTWRQCAEKLRELHPDLFRHKVTIEVRNPTQSVRDYVNSITGTHLDQSLKR
jgi:hypothetical protein